MDDLRFAIFGTGFWSRFQLAGWQELKGVKCVALYNRTVSKAEKVAREFGIPAVYGDPEELLRREKLDFVDIITDPWTHSRFVHMAAAHKLPVICQKPMAATLAEAEKMVKTCREAGVPYLIHENWLADAHYGTQEATRLGRDRDALSRAHGLCFGISGVHQ
jgi:predicted dehydrogenase